MQVGDLPRVGILGEEIEVRSRAHNRVVPDLDGLGVLARLMPQMQVYFVGVPLSILAGFLILAVVIAAGQLLTYDDVVAALLAQAPSPVDPGGHEPEMSPAWRTPAPRGQPS